MKRTLDTLDTTTIHNVDVLSRWVAARGGWRALTPDEVRQLQLCAARLNLQSAEWAHGGRHIVHGRDPAECARAILDGLNSPQAADWELERFLRRRLDACSCDAAEPEHCHRRPQRGVACDCSCHYGGPDEERVPGCTPAEPDDESPWGAGVTA